MRKKIDRQYILNRETLEYEEVEQPSTTKRYIRTIITYAASSISVFILSLYLITDVFHTRTPKGMIVHRDYSEWRSKLNLLERRLEAADQSLLDMERRDNMLYRSVFGMETIPTQFGVLL